MVEIGRLPRRVLPANFYYHWSMFPHHHVIEEEDDDDMELQSEEEGNGTYSATGMAISERIGMGAKLYRY